MIVPFAAIAYIILAFVVLFAHADKIVEIFQLIFSCAFNQNAAYGAVFGLAIQWGVSAHLLERSRSRYGRASLRRGGSLTRPSKALCKPSRSSWDALRLLGHRRS